MIYLVITASLLSRYGVPQTRSDREERYRYAITETLSHLPDTGDIRPVIVENNGPRPTLLDHFTWNHRGVQEKVPVVYTTHNETQFQNKGVNELMDIQAAMKAMNAIPSDMIIKVTGRYRVRSPSFFETVCRHPEKEAFVKWYNVHAQKEDPNDCVLGCYALRALYLQLLFPCALNLYDSAEVGFAQYVRRSLSSASILSMNELGVECVFADLPTVTRYV